MTSSFVAQYPELQHLARELELVRQHNLKFKDGDPQDQLLMFSEGALVCLTLERFLRVVLGGKATESDTLFNLLQKAVSQKLITLGWKNQQDGINRIVKVRNGFLHGSYEQAAREAGCSSVNEYFKTQFASELEVMYMVTNSVMAQIDPLTGKPR